MAFVRAYEIIALDEALGVLDLLIINIAGEAKKLGQKKRLRALKDLDKSALALAEVCAMILNEGMQDELLRSAIFARMPREKLAESLATVNELARPYEEDFQDEMVAQYGRVRCFLPKLICNTEFKAAPAGKATSGSTSISGWSAEITQTITGRCSERHRFQFMKAPGIRPGRTSDQARLYAVLLDKLCSFPHLDVISNERFVLVHF